MRKTAGILVSMCILAGCAEPEVSPTEIPEIGKELVAQVSDITKEVIDTVNEAEELKEEEPELDEEEEKLVYTLNAIPYEDVIINTSPESTPILLINKNIALDQGYVPSDLTPVTSSGENGTVMMRSEAAQAFEELVTWGKTQGMTITACSAYRSAEYQGMLWTNGANAYGVDYADLYWTRAGHSEHQTGLAVDIRLNNDFSDLDAVRNYPEHYALLLDHLAEYGFILRYPEDKQEITHIAPESWHLRYVGKEHARKIKESGMCLEEYYITNV